MAIRNDGPVAAGTRLNLIQGLRSKPMPVAAVDAVLRQASDFTESIVNTYETCIAAGEVGADGSGVASPEPILGPLPPAALIYGRVQSGKTAAMVLTSALALDNGFRIIIVLTADNVDLVRQTANRFKDLDGPRVLSTLKEDETSEWKAPEWEATEEEFLNDLRRDGLVFVCAKNALHLPAVLTFLLRIDAASYPSLILDDEADAATPDLTLQARAAGRANAPAFGSTIHRNIIANDRPGEEGQSARENLPHSVYVQVTASPFVLFLQRLTSRIRPTLPLLLEPGPGYCGGERFFGAFDPDSVDPPNPPLVLVSARESQAIARRPVPVGLARSVDLAFVAATALASSRAGQWPEDGFKHLSHTSPNVDQHTLVAQHIERHIATLRRELRDEPAAAQARLEIARTELLRTVPDAPGIEALIGSLTSAVRQAQVLRINASAARPPYGPRVNFLVGGNILGRGLTIDDLLITYYLREAQTSQMDTVLQHARMYGYREVLMPYTRVFLPPQLAARFREIHLAEEKLRGILRRERGGEQVPIKIAAGTRATRPGALETGSLRVYGGDIQQVAPRFLLRDGDRARQVRDVLLREGVPLREASIDRRGRQVSVAVLSELVELLQPRADDPGRWDLDAIRGLVRAYDEEFAGSGIVYVRWFDDEPDDARTRARLRGTEVDTIQRLSPRAPALALIYWQNEASPELWFPTLVFPRNSPTYIFGPADGV